MNRIKYLMVRTTVQEQRAWIKAAKKQGMTLSAWVRQLVYKELAK